MSYAELASLVTFRPLSTPLPPATYEGQHRSPFSASWTTTVHLLAREVKHLQTGGPPVCGICHPPTHGLDVAAA